MTNLLLECRDSGRRLLLLAVLCLLAACGPGSGGTGTGPLGFSSISASPGAGGSLPDPPAGPGGGLFPPAACTGDCTDVDLLLQAGRVEVTGGCGRFVFEGHWDTDESGQVLLLGLFENPAVGVATAATLRLKFDGLPETSPFVTLTLTAEAGQTLMGPTVLGRVETIVPPAPGSGCPS